MNGRFSEAKHNYDVRNSSKQKNKCRQLIGWRILVTSNAPSAMSAPPLSPELAARATKELHEKAEWRSRDVDALRNSLSCERDLRPCPDEQFLLRFLRARKFDYDSAKRMVIRYYTVRRPRKFSIFIDFTPASVRDFLETGFIDVRDGCDFSGAVILLIDFGLLSVDQLASIDTITKSLLLVLEWLLLRNARAQICGITVVMDVRACTLSDIIGAVRSNALKTLIQCTQVSSNFATQNCVPMRLRGMHVLHGHFLGSLWLHAALRGTISEHVLKKVHVHGANVSALSDYMDLDSLPAATISSQHDFKRPRSSERGPKLARDIESDQSYFERMATYGYLGSDATNAEEQSCGGSPFQCLFVNYKRVCIDGLNE